MKEPARPKGEAAATVLPRPRAFVIQLASDAAPEGGHVRGRAVHIASGEAAPFESVAELLRFLESAIARAEDGH